MPSARSDPPHRSPKDSFSLRILQCLTSSILIILYMVSPAQTFDQFDKSEPFLDKINLEKSIAEVFNKVAYGSTTKRSIPDNAYPVTTLATPLLTTYRYSDGNEEWLRVDLKNSEDEGDNRESARSSVDFEQPDFEPDPPRREEGYGSDLEKDHALPTSAPAADILKNNNNKNYNNPNRYNNDRLRPDFQTPEQVTESVYKTTTTYNLLRNIRPTKSIYSKDPPSYVPPSRAFFTPPLPPELQNPFADKPTLRGTNSDSFVNRRPLPPPSLMPNKDRIPYRPDLPKVNTEKVPDRVPISVNTNNDLRAQEKKKSLNTPSQNVRLDFSLNRNVNESNFEYDKTYVPSMTRILSGSNGRHDDFPDILLRTVTAPPKEDKVKAKTRPPNAEPSLKIQEPEEKKPEREEKPISKKEIVQERSETSTRKEDKKKTEDVTTQISESENLKKEQDTNVTIAGSDETWLICWNVHVYLVVIGYVLLAAFSIVKLVRYENDPHMFSKSYFLTIHLMLTCICVLRIFYLTYDPYNVDKSFNVFLEDFLHSFPLSLLVSTFAVLIVFLLKRTLTHLKVKARPMYLVFISLAHIALCLILSTFETFGYLSNADFTICKPILVLLTCTLGLSYLYLYKMIKNVLARESQNLSEMCTQNISAASHTTIAAALLFVVLGIVQLYALFFLKIDNFNGMHHHWILWGFELSIRVLEISIMTLLAIVASFKISQREKQSAGGFPLFPCTTSDSSADNIYPNNCNTNPNAMNYSRQEMILDNIPTEAIERPNLLKNTFQNDSFDKKSTLERYQSDSERGSNFDRFERPKWGSERFERSADQNSLNSFAQPPSGNFSHSHSNRNSGRKGFDGKYYPKAKFDVEYNNEDYQHEFAERNIYAEPVDGHQYERTRHEFERSDFDRRSRNSNTSGRRTSGRTRKNHARPHLGIQTLPTHHQDSVLVADQGYLRFKMDEPKRKESHYSDA